MPKYRISPIFPGMKIIWHNGEKASFDNEERIEKVDKSMIIQPSLSIAMDRDRDQEDDEGEEGHGDGVGGTLHCDEGRTSITDEMTDSSHPLTREEKHVIRLTSRLQSATAVSPRGKQSPRAAVPLSEWRKK